MKQGILTVNRQTVPVVALLLTLVVVGCGERFSSSAFFNRIDLAPMYAECEKSFENLQNGDTHSRGVWGPRTVGQELSVVGSIDPGKLDALLKNWKAQFKQAAQVNGATLTEENDPNRKDGSEGFLFSYTVGDSHHGTIRASAEQTEEPRRYKVKCTITDIAN
jgi:hypothetical protein